MDTSPISVLNTNIGSTVISAASRDEVIRLTVEYSVNRASTSRSGCTTIASRSSANATGSNSMSTRYSE